MKKIVILLAAAFLLYHTSESQTCGTTNVALTKTTTSSSYYDQFSMSSMAVDGNTSIPWKSGNETTSSITIDLGQSYSICQVKLYWPTQFYFASAYTLYVSEDNSTWTQYSTPVSAGDGGEDVISASGVGRYIKLSCTEKAASWADRYELNEFEVYVGTTPPSNNPPTVSITSPSNNTSVTEGSGIALSATASDNDGSVTQVEFFRGTTSLGTPVTSSPYNFTWNNAAPGTYSITAKATDNDGAVTTSAAITLTVTASGNWSLTGNAGINPANHFIGTTDNNRLVFKTGGDPRMTITAEGKILVNTTTLPDADADFAVKGNIWAKKLKITQSYWSDFVFDSAYRLRPLQEVEKFINEHRHLPDVPSAAQVVKDGISVGDNQATLLQKIEELTLYLIEQDKKIKALEAALKSVKK